MKVKIDIETRTFVRFGMVLLGFIAAIGAIFVAQGALVTIIIALFLALALNPAVSWLAKKLPGKSRTGASAISYLVVVTLLATFLFAFVPPVIEQSAKFAKTVPQLIDNVASKRSIFDDFINRYNLRSTVDKAIEDTKNQAAAVSTELGSIVVNSATATFGGIITLMFVLILTFFMLIEGPEWLSKIWGLYDDPDKLERHRSLVNKMYRVVTGFVGGQVTVAAIGGVVSFVGLLVMSFIPQLGIPANLALPLATLLFLSALIPMIGTTLGCVLVSLVLLLNSPLAALVFAIFFVTYQQIDNNFITPTIQARAIDLSVLMILVAILIGTSLFGLLGGLVAIPLAGCVRVLLVDYLDYAAKKRKQKTAHEKQHIEKLVKKLKES